MFFSGKLFICRESSTLRTPKFFQPNFSTSLHSFSSFSTRSFAKSNPKRGNKQPQKSNEFENIEIKSFDESDKAYQSSIQSNQQNTNQQKTEKPRTTRVKRKKIIYDVPKDRNYEPLAPKNFKNHYKKLPLGYERVDKILSNCKFATRRFIARWISRNNVTIKIGEETLEDNSIKELVKKAHPADITRRENIRINGEPLRDTVLPEVILMNKPRGYTCTHIRDEPESKIVFDLLPPSYNAGKPKYSVAGRLDKWASGVLILSRNGKFIQKIIHPKVELQKSYLVQLKHPVKGGEEEKFASGEIMLRSEKKPCLPAVFQNIDKKSKIVRIVLSEGKYHQIRRMVATVGNLVLTVHRERVGNLSVNDLKPGQWRPLTRKEIAYFTNENREKIDYTADDTPVETIKQVLSQGGLDSSRIYKKAEQVNNKAGEVMEKDTNELESQEALHNEEIEADDEQFNEEDFENDGEDDEEFEIDEDFEDEEDFDIEELEEPKTKIN